LSGFQKPLNRIYISPCCRVSCIRNGFMRRMAFVSLVIYILVQCETTSKALTIQFQTPQINHVCTVFALLLCTKLVELWTLLATIISELTEREFYLLPGNLLAQTTQTWNLPE
jgi:hypothetical protein